MVNYDVLGIAAAKYVFLLRDSVQKQAQAKKRVQTQHHTQLFPPIRLFAAITAGILTSSMLDNSHFEHVLEHIEHMIDQVQIQQQLYHLLILTILVRAARGNADFSQQKVEAYRDKAAIYDNKDQLVYLTLGLVSHLEYVQFGLQG